MALLAITTFSKSPRRPGEARSSTMPMSVDATSSCSTWANETVLPTTATLRKVAPVCDQRRMP
jgi:hypothetical protein